MVLAEDGVAQSKILEDLARRTAGDLRYDNGRIIGSMCTTPHPFAKEVFSKYIYKNLGDSGLFPESAKIEEELISDIGGLFGDSSATGEIVSGGSEANIISVRIAKKLNPNMSAPEIVLPETGHLSFDKAAEMMGVKLIKVPVDDHYQLDMSAYRDSINDNTIGVVGIAGTTALGLVDPIEEIGALSREFKLYFHVDAAFGGFVLPFLKELGHDVPKWNFEVRDVDSITADPHKMGRGVIPSGGFLIREGRTKKHLTFEIPYLAGGGKRHLSILGTHPGGSALSFYALMKHLGRSGFRKIVSKSWDNTILLRDGIEDIDGVRIATEPTTNVIGIIPEYRTGSSSELLCEFAGDLRKKGWALGKFERFGLARAVLMPHVTEEHVRELLCEIKESIASLKMN